MTGIDGASSCGAMIHTHAAERPRTASPEAPEPSPSLPHVPQPPVPNEPQMPEIGEPKVYPIHPEIPTQPIHEPVREPDHVPPR